MYRAAPPAGPKQWDTNPSRHARGPFGHLALLIERGRDCLAKPKSGPADRRTPSLATTGLGVAGTLGPEGQAAFSYGRPVNRHPNRTRRPKEGGGVWLFQSSSNLCFHINDFEPLNGAICLQSVCETECVIQFKTLEDIETAVESDTPAAVAHKMSCV